MILIAHNIRSLHNVGSIFRSADAFAVSKIFLTGYTGTPPRKEIAKVALGSEHRVSWEYLEDVNPLIDQLKKEGVLILALDNIPGAVPIDQIETSNKVALILGNETEGIESQVIEQVDQTIFIPMPGIKRSLNVSVATGIALFALSGSTQVQ